MKRAIGIVVAAAVLVLAGCGGSDNKSADTGVGDKEVATGGRLFTTADEETAKLGSDARAGRVPADGEARARRDRHPGEAERVVVLDSGELDDVLALGITPVGMATNAGTERRTVVPRRQGAGHQDRRRDQRAEPRGDRGAEAGPDPGQQAAGQRPVHEAERDRADRVQHPARVPVEGELPAGRGRGRRGDQGDRAAERLPEARRRGEVARSRVRRRSRWSGSVPARSGCTATCRSSASS